MRQTLSLLIVVLATLLVVIRAEDTMQEVVIRNVKSILSPLLMTPDCFDNFITEFPPSTTCLKSTISKGLGFGIIAGSFALKLPQIINIIKGKSADGMILSALYLETSSVISTSLYNIIIGTPLSTYAESMVIVIQNIILIMLCWYYKKTPMMDRLTMIVAATAYITPHFFLPPQYLSLIMVVATVTSLSGRVRQIAGNFSAKSTGVLSLPTTIMQVGGTAARVFTTLQEVDDLAILLSFLISFILNLTILLQIFIYWNNRTIQEADTSAKDKKKD